MDAFSIVGISTRTNNNEGRAAVDIGLLWQKLFEENVAARISDKVSEDIYCIYTDYQSNYQGDYTTLLGFKVSSAEHVPEGLPCRSFEHQSTVKFVALGKMPDAVLRTWKEIWQKDHELQRAYTYDAEVYGKRSKTGSDTAEVDIYISVRSTLQTNFP